MNQPTSPSLQPPPGAMASMILGIVGLVFGCSPVGLILGIIALVKAGKAKRLAQENPNLYQTDGGGMRVAGFVCGLIALILGALGTIYLAIVIPAIIAGAASAAASSGG